MLLYFTINFGKLWIPILFIYQSVSDACSEVLFRGDGHDSLLTLHALILSFSCHLFVTYSSTVLPLNPPHFSHSHIFFVTSLSAILSLAKPPYGVTLDPFLNSRNYLHLSTYHLRKCSQGSHYLNLNMSMETKGEKTITISSVFGFLIFSWLDFS